VLAAQQTMEHEDWYEGTADAVRRNMRYVRDDAGQDVLILAGDQLYRMDFRWLAATHWESRADVTIAVLPVADEAAAQPGIVRLDDSGRVTGFVEEPKTPAELAPWRTPEVWLAGRHIRPAGRQFLASMGIYLFRRAALVELLNTQPPATDFG